MKQYTIFFAIWIHGRARQVFSTWNRLSFGIQHVFGTETVEARFINHFAIWTVLLIQSTCSKHPRNRLIGSPAIVQHVGRLLYYIYTGI